MTDVTKVEIAFFKYFGPINSILLRMNLPFINFFEKKKTAFDRRDKGGNCDFRIF